MANEGPFGLNPDDFDKFAREASDGLRDVVGQVGKMIGQSGGAPWGAFFGETPARPKPEPETTGQKGDGVWAIYQVDDAGAAHIDQLFATELDALRAHKDNVDPLRRVRFLPYGVSVSVLDSAED